ncbi:hypothetical protein ACTXT7_016430 [Hymenolepis weldensis]
MNTLYTKLETNMIIASADPNVKLFHITDSRRSSVPLTHRSRNNKPSPLDTFLVLATLGVA